MKTSHEGLGITAADWDAAVKHLTDSLDKFKVPAKEKGELLAVVSSLKGDIVEKPLGGS